MLSDRFHIVISYIVIVMLTPTSIIVLGEFDLKYATLGFLGLHRVDSYCVDNKKSQGEC